MHCSLNDEMVPEDLSLRALVDGVLNDIKFREKRARTMDIDDFMRLLAAFNEKGIHFV